MWEVAVEETKEELICRRSRELWIGIGAKREELLTYKKMAKMCQASIDEMLMAIEDLHFGRNTKPEETTDQSTMFEDGENPGAWWKCSGCGATFSENPGESHQVVTADSDTGEVIDTKDCGPVEPWSGLSLVTTSTEE